MFSIYSLLDILCFDSFFLRIVKINFFLNFTTDFWSTYNEKHYICILYYIGSAAIDFIFLWIRTQCLFSSYYHYFLLFLPIRLSTSLTPPIRIVITEPTCGFNDNQAL